MELIQQAASEWNAPAISIFIACMANIVFSLYAKERLDQIVEQAACDGRNRELSDEGGGTADEGAID